MGYRHAGGGKLIGALRIRIPFHRTVLGSRGRQRRLQRTAVRYIVQRRVIRLGIHRNSHRNAVALATRCAAIGRHIVGGIRIQCRSGISRVCGNRRSSVLHHVPATVIAVEAGSCQCGGLALAYRSRRAGGCSRFRIHHNRKIQTVAFATVKQGGGIVMVCAGRLLWGIIVTLIVRCEGVATRSCIIPNNRCTRGYRSRQDLVFTGTKAGGEVVGADARDVLHHHLHMHTFALATR